MPWITTESDKLNIELLIVTCLVRYSHHHSSWGIRSSLSFSVFRRLSTFQANRKRRCHYNISTELVGQAKAICNKSRTWSPVGLRRSGRLSKCLASAQFLFRGTPTGTGSTRSNAACCIQTLLILLVREPLSSLLLLLSPRQRIWQYSWTCFVFAVSPVWDEQEREREIKQPAPHTSAKATIHKINRKVPASI